MGYNFSIEGIRKGQARPPGAFPWLWRWGPTPKAREKRPGDEAAKGVPFMVKRVREGLNGVVAFTVIG